MNLVAKRGSCGCALGLVALVVLIVGAGDVQAEQERGRARGEECGRPRNATEDENGRRMELQQQERGDRQRGERRGQRGGGRERGMVEELNRPRRERRQVDELPATPRLMRFKATVFEVEVAAERVVELDAGELTKQAQTPAALLAALRSYGVARVMYGVDQCVNAQYPDRNEFQVRRDSPYISAAHTSKDGEVMRSVAREHDGVLFNVTVFPDPKSGVLLANVRVELSGMSESEIEVGEGVKSPVFWDVEQSYQGPARPGKATVLLALGGGGDGEMGRVFVTLFELEDVGE